MTTNSQVGQANVTTHKILRKHESLHSNSVDLADHLTRPQSAKSRSRISLMRGTHSPHGGQLDSSLEDVGGASVATEPGRSERPNQSGPMSMFFKVWSRVKRNSSAASGRQKAAIRRQNSEDATHFCYVPGDQVEQQRCAMVLKDGHFRQANSQPTSRQASNEQTNSGKLLSDPLSGTGSSGVSTASSSSTGQTRSPSSTSSSPPTNISNRQKLRRSAAEDDGDSGRVSIQAKAMNREQESSSWMVRIKRSASSIGQQSSFGNNQSGHQNGKRKSIQYGKVNESDKVPGLSFSEALESTQRDGSETSDSAADVYSTPHESIQSVQSGLRLVKSFSTNNFNPNLQAKRINEDFKPIDENHEVKHRSNLNHRPDLKSQQDLARGSKMFISSSSSEESSATSTHSAIPMTSKVSRQTRSSETDQMGQASISFRFGRHIHSVSPPSPAVRPNSILVSNGLARGLILPVLPESNQLFSPNTKQPNEILIPADDNSQAVAAMSPLEPMSFGVNKPAWRRHELSRIQVAYRKSPSLFEFREVEGGNSACNISSKCARSCDRSQGEKIPNSVSLQDCQTILDKSTDCNGLQRMIKHDVDSEYRLAKMMLESGQDPRSTDENGQTALMHACLSGNMAAVKCLIDHGADVNQTDVSGFSSLDLICSKQPTETRLEIVKYLIDHKAELDKVNSIDGSRLLDRLIKLHDEGPKLVGTNKLPYIDCLLQNGARLGSSTWRAAHSKHKLQMRLLKKLCQDGYYLYKVSSIEAAIYRFEYALKRLAGLEHQLLSTANSLMYQLDFQIACKHLKYHIYLGLSRCERKRGVS